MNLAGELVPARNRGLDGRVSQFRVANLCISRLPFDERFEVIFLGIPRQRHALLFTGNSSDPDDGSALPSCTRWRSVPEFSRRASCP